MSNKKCQAITKSGAQCSRDVEKESKFCWQHQNTKLVDNDDLTDKQQAFCEEYVVDLNATQAAIRAGYSEESANNIGPENLLKPSIQKEIDRLKKARSKRTQITADRNLEELGIIGYSKITDYLQVVEKEIVIGYEKDSDGDPDYHQPITRLQKVVEIKETDEMDLEAIRAISEIKESKHGISLKLHDKLKALDKIGNHLGMWKDKVEHEINDISSVEIELVDDEG